MFKWTADQRKHIETLVGTGSYSNGSIAKVMGCSKATIKRYSDANGLKNFDGRGRFRTGRQEAHTVIDLYEQDITQSFQDVAAAMELPVQAVRFVLERHEKTQAEIANAEDADLDLGSTDRELAALRAAHPDRQYEDAPEAADEPRLSVPMRARTIFNEMADARYRVPQPGPRPITLAAA